MMLPSPSAVSSRDDKSICVDSSSSHDDDEGTNTDSDALGRSGEGANNSAADKKKQEESIAKEETKAVNVSKQLVSVFLLVAAFSVGTVTYFVTLHQETDNFENEFRKYALEIVTLTNLALNLKLEALRSFSIAITSYAMNQNSSSWPGVTLPDWEVQAAQTRELVNADFLLLAPIVTGQSQRSLWNTYSQQQAPTWISESLPYALDEDGTISENNTSPASRLQISNEIYQDNYLQSTKFNSQVPVVNDTYLPVWQVSPPPVNASLVNLDLFSDVHMQVLAQNVERLQAGMLSQMVNVTAFHKAIYGDTTTRVGPDRTSWPTSVIVEPIFERFPSYLYDTSRVTKSINSTADAFTPVVGFVVAGIPWLDMMQHMLPGREGDNVKRGGVLLYIFDRCGHDFTFHIHGDQGDFVGYGDYHDVKFDRYRIAAPFALKHDPLTGNVVHSSTFCEFTLYIYPTHQLSDSYHSGTPTAFTSVVVLVFFFTAMVFLLYDCMVQRRQDTVLQSASRTQAIVSSLFPKSVQDRIFEGVQQQPAAKADTGGIGRNSVRPGPGKMKKAMVAFVDQESKAIQASGKSYFKTKPIADLFPDVTIMFADIVGFTAWSSMREPTQVFTLLETIYHVFDETAKRRRVFKVETVGDCYVAVAGLPDPRKDHAVVMARFAKDCLFEFNRLTKDLEVDLGPDTGDLGLRTGLHSGQVTAGVLRGERARFQLFGDTVNTTSRIETTGMGDRIHMSRETADLITASGKGHWVIPREDAVHAKGKGELKTFWLDVHRQSSGGGSKSDRSSNSGVPSDKSVSNRSGIETDEEDDDDNDEDLSISESEINPQSDGGRRDSGDTTPTPQLRKSLISVSDQAKEQRLVTWNAEILTRLIREVVAHREAAGIHPDPVEHVRDLEFSMLHKSNLVLDEVQEMVRLPRYDASMAEKQKDPYSIVLSDAVLHQIRDYIESLARLYCNNPFHNFEHASHVTMSVVKLLSRIVAPKLSSNISGDKSKHLHDHTYGITSDPLTQFTVILSALIHDVDHPGVPNAQLVNERHPAAQAYNNKSIAEQKSVDVAWNLLMDSRYEDLRRAIYTTERELIRFRELLVNTVMATDIMDKDLGARRKDRWNKAFSEDGSSWTDEQVDRRATIVIEHLIQASDVAHTMQHWHIYRKWNLRLFEEIHKAYVEGRAASDPAEFWYKGELGFFDFYIIPLAKKLKDCGVFGVSSDEYLNYATQNRIEWERKGMEIVEEMAEALKKRKSMGQLHSSKQSLQQQ